MALAIPVLLAGCGGPYSILDPAGPSAHLVARLWWGMFGFLTLVLLVVVTLWLHAMRREPGEHDERHVRRISNRWIIAGGLVLPLATIVLLLGFGIPIGHRMLPLPPADGEALQVHVTGHQWHWVVRHPGAGIERVDEMHIPAGMPVDVVLESADVIHSFWVPRLAGKVDLIPGHTNVLRIQADVPGIYRGQCAEFCGAGHAHMQLVVHVLEPAAYQAWLDAVHDGD